MAQPREADFAITGAVVLDRPAAGFRMADAPSAIAIRGNQILAVGSDAEIGHWIGRATTVRRLAGHVVTPGLFDSHNHMLKTALGARMPSLEAARDVSDVLEVIKKTRDAQGPGQWIQCSPGWHESRLREGRLPSVDELDVIAPDAPVFLRRGGHNAILNSRAIDQLGVQSSDANPNGATMVRDAEGRLTGHIIGAPLINRLALQLPAPSHKDKTDALHELGRQYLRMGITSVIEPGLSAADIRLLQTLNKSGQLAVRTHAMWRLAYQGEDIDDVVAAIESEEIHPSVGERFSVFGIKLSMDGGAETGYFRQPYAHPDDVASPYGKPLLSKDQLVKIALAAARRAWHVGVHCVGDAAIDEVLAAFADVDRSVDLSDRRWSLIHMMCARDDQWSEVRRLGLTVTAQQPLVYALGEGFSHYLGEERASRLVPLATMVKESSLPVGGGSDSPVASFDPWIGISSSVTRQIASGRVLGAEHRVPPLTALEMYTVGSAFCAFQEGSVGRLDPGMLADLLVLQPEAFSAESVPAAGPLMTIADGRILHDDL
jgi:predicted amidohydrolase YtcJ